MDEMMEGQPMTEAKRKLCKVENRDDGELTETVVGVFLAHPLHCGENLQNHYSAV
jgi:hypothetical protein